MDYLQKLAAAKTVDECALYLRAQGCRLLPMLRAAYSDVSAIKMISEYESDAEIVQNFSSLKEAKGYLKSKGYFK